MDCEQPDSLEGWVPLREDLFREPERHQLRFLVAWNAQEGQFAVTCHDRTAQRRRGPPDGGGGGCSWAGLLSAAGFRGAHRQLAALWPALERCFPPLPPEVEAAGGRGWGLRRGLWALMWPAPVEPGDAALQELCRQLERYLGQAAEGCGGATVRDVLFPAPGDPADCEGLREFREKTLRARLDGAAARLRQVRGVRPGGGRVPGTLRVSGVAGAPAPWLRGSGGRCWGRRVVFGGLFSEAGSQVPQAGLNSSSLCLSYSRAGIIRVQLCAKARSLSLSLETGSHSVV